MNGIKFVYFDIGGVMIKDFSETQEWNQMTTRWGIPENRKDEINTKFREFIGDVVEGKGSVEGLKTILKSDFGIVMSPEYSVLTDFVNNFDKNEEMWGIVKECQKEFKVGLLTDMYPGMFEAIKNRGLLPEIDFLIVDSSIEKCQKPYEKIYKIAEDRCRFSGGEILFIDNVRKNLIVPEKMGWKTFFYSSANYEQSNRELREYLNLPPNPPPRRAGLL